MTTSEQRLSVEDSANHFAAARGSMSRWLEPRGLPVYKIGRIWMFERSQIDTWVDKGGAESDNVQGGAR